MGAVKPLLRLELSSEGVNKNRSRLSTFWPFCFEGLVGSLGGSLSRNNDLASSCVRLDWYTEDDDDDDEVEGVGFEVEEEEVEDEEVEDEDFALRAFGVGATVRCGFNNASSSSSSSLLPPEASAPRSAALEGEAGADSPTPS